MDDAANLHSLLYLVSYDRARQRFISRGPLLEFSLRAAMLTDLHLSGHLYDVNGKATQANSPPPDDPVLRWAFDTIGPDGCRWANAIARSNHAVRVVRDQLRTDGWLHRRRHLVLGIFPSSGEIPTDDGAVAAFAEKARDAVLRAVAGRPCEPRPLATGLLAVHAQFDTVLSRRECIDLLPELRQLTAATIAPITGLATAIASHNEDVRRLVGDAG
ncbi:MAG: GPP34 family phosphoprotein [Mycobacterium sp.]